MRPNNIFLIMTISLIIVLSGLLVAYAGEPISLKMESVVLP